MDYINLDLIVEFAATQHLEVQNYDDPAIKANPNKYLYYITDNNIIDCSPSQFYIQSSLLGLKFIDKKTKQEMNLDKPWRQFLLNKNLAYADRMLDEIKVNKRVINNTTYKISSTENQKVKDEKIADLKLIENEVYEYLDDFVNQFYK